MLASLTRHGEPAPGQTNARNILANRGTGKRRAEWREADIFVENEYDDLLNRGEEPPRKNWKTRRLGKLCSGKSAVI